MDIRMSRFGESCPSFRFVVTSGFDPFLPLADEGFVYKYRFKPSKHTRLFWPLRKLKVRWRDLPTLEKWRLLRAITGHEHLCFKRAKLGYCIPCGPLLRRRRLEMANAFVDDGFEVHPALLEWHLPRGPSGRWLDSICSHRGPTQ